MPVRRPGRAARILTASQKESPVPTRSWTRRPAAAVLVAALAASNAIAQNRPEPTPAELLRDFIHYTRIARYDLARANAQALLDRELPPADFVKLVEDSGELQRFEETAVRSQRAAELEGVAARLLKAYEQGKLDQARNAEEIARNISLLTGTQRQRLVARERLAAAGEYAVPQLLQALLRRTEPALQAEVRQLLVDMGRQAVMPLAASLSGLEPASQEAVAAVLGDIPYPASVPFLADLANSTSSQEVAVAARRAIDRIQPGRPAGSNVSELYRNLAEGYYAENTSLTSFPRESHQLLWRFDPAIGLLATPVATPVFHEAMAMTLSERALALDATNAEALALWLAANFSREMDTPEGYENPAYPPTRRAAVYYAVAAGSVPAQRVLARAIDARDTGLARRAIGALQQSTGAEGLASGLEGRSPLLEALQYPSRRVQYEAALAIGRAQPTTAFAGSDRVVPLLAAAIRDAEARYAIVAAADAERQNALSELLRGRGYTVLPGARRLADIEEPIAAAPGIDLIVTDLSPQGTRDLVADARGRARLAATPILVLAPQETYPQLAGDLEGDPLTRVTRAGVDPAQLAGAAEQLIETAAGGAISSTEAAAYQTEAVRVLRDLAVSGNPVLDVADASRPLIAALPDATGELRLEIAEVLARTNTAQAQVALVDTAIASAGPDRVALLEKAADSAKRFGGHLQDRHVRGVIELVETGPDAEATAAAALVGALNLPNNGIVPLILSGEGSGEGRRTSSR